MFHEGIEEHKTAIGMIRVYSVAKTIVDCFRFRNKVGLDVAIEALRETISNRRRYGITICQVSEMARQCRVGEVMRPYLEAMIT
jgi:predicted transcriptional regulator of viral defense system